MRSTDAMELKKAGLYPAATNLPIRPSYAEAFVEAYADSVKAHARADRAEFLLAIMAQCVGVRFMQIHMLLWPGPVERDGVTLDGSDKVKAIRHDMIRNLFHS